MVNFLSILQAVTASVGAHGVYFQCHQRRSRCQARAGIAHAVSPHWLRHAHGSHALDRGATLAEVQTTLGHANVATTSGYLHARPNTSCGLKLDEGIFR
jgi:integrase/recombinase XerD